MITILHVIENLANFGGTPRKMLYLTKYTDHDRYHHIFLCFKEPELGDEFRSNGASVIHLDSLSPWSLVWKIAAKARELHADVICTHFTRSLITGYFASRLTNLPLIHNEHGPATLRTGPAGLSVRIGRCLSWYCLPRSNVIINNSNFTRDTVRKIFSPPESKLRVVYNPVEARQKAEDIPSSPEAVSAQQNFVVGHVGGMTVWRDQATLIQAFHLLHEKHSDVHLTLIGDGPTRTELEVLVEKYSLREHVTFIGYSNAIGEYLDTMSVYVNPALEEGFGIAVVEAMLAKRPVVLSDRGAHPELIKDGYSGLLYKGGDAKDLAQKLEWLFAHPDERTSIGAEAKRHATNMFTPDKYASSYLRIVDEVIGYR